MVALTSLDRNQSYQSPNLIIFRFNIELDKDLFSESSIERNKEGYIDVVKGHELGHVDQYHDVLRGFEILLDGLPNVDDREWKFLGIMDYATRWLDTQDKGKLEADATRRGKQYIPSRYWNLRDNPYIFTD